MKFWHEMMQYARVRFAQAQHDMWAGGDRRQYRAVARLQAMVWRNYVKAGGTV